MLAAWPAIDEGLAVSTRRASHAALAVGAALHDYDAGNDVRLSLRLGVGAGEVMALHVGGVGGRWQLLLSGAPLLEVSQAEQRAAPGEAVLSPGRVAGRAAARHSPVPQSAGRRPGRGRPAGAARARSGVPVQARGDSGGRLRPAAVRPAPTAAPRSRSGTNRPRPMICRCCIRCWAT